MNTYQDLDNYTHALPSEFYLIRLIHLDKENFKPLKRIWTKETLLKSVTFLQAKNCEGYNIYARPKDYSFILLDDVQKAMLAEIAQIKPSVLIETSPQNYQVWLRLSEVPETREHALAICKHLATMFEADMGSAEPDHVGRLPGFTNRKPKHQNDKGLFPFCKLHHYADRCSSFSTQSVSCAKKEEKQSAKQIKVPPHTGIDQSRVDFNLACMLIRQKKSEAYIYEKIKEQYNADKHKESDYIPRTIKNARKAVGNNI